MLPHNRRVDFLDTLEKLCAGLERNRVRYALIGGFALAMHGVQRATVDLDFILALEDLARVDRILQEMGYERFFHTENVSHYRTSTPGAGRIAMLHAFRAPALAMLQRAKRLTIGRHLTLPVVAVEDLVGLKIQAACNDPRRAAGDWQDIFWLLEAAARRAAVLDWELIAEYLALFGQTTRLGELKKCYDPID